MRTLLTALLLTPIFSFGQLVCTPQDRSRLDASLEKLEKMDPAGREGGAIAVEIGKEFLGTPYLEKTLEIPGEEQLVINLSGLDCTTYLETVLALFRAKQKGDLSFDRYQQELEFIRYRKGVRQGYPSRLHYFSDWIFDNEAKGVLKDITEEIGGIPYTNPTGFMSQNPQYYPQLSDAGFLEEIREQEKAIASRTYFYLPKAQVSQAEAQIREGDLIAITLSMKNLDIGHVGMAVQKEGRIHLMHASTTSREVVISDKPLHDYLAGNRSQTGIMVCRLVD